jgi:hypothetical protein
MDSVTETVDNSQISHMSSVLESVHVCDREDVTECSLQESNGTAFLRSQTNSTDEECCIYVIRI